MTRYITQVRVLKMPNRTAAPDRWSSATSELTIAEASVPFDAEEDEETVTRSQPYLDALSRAVVMLASSPGPWPASRE